MKNYKWYIEQTSDDEIIFHSLKEIIHSDISPYQRIEVIRSGNLGRCLLLDGKMQSSEADEFIYHEALVHPVMLLNEYPQRVLIAGGGEGATLREVLKYPVNEVVMVDLDESVIKVSREYLPEWSSGAFDDPRVRLVIDDARVYIEKVKNHFDVIIVDLPEPAEDTPAFLLYTIEFYEKVKEALTDSGMMVTQSASASVNNLRVFISIVTTLKYVFPYVAPYLTYIPSFFAPWSFVLVSKKAGADKTLEKIEDKLSAMQDKLKFYDMDAHIGMFHLPKHIKTAIQKGGVVIHDDCPISFY